MTYALTSTDPKSQTGSISKIRFRRGNHSGFYRALKTRAKQYFDETGATRFAGRNVAYKGLLFAGLSIGSYALILTSGLPPQGLLLLALLFGVSTLLLAINVAHDAAHDALVPNRRLNTWIQTLAFIPVGADAYLWRLRHVKSHHTFPNVNGCDIDIDSNGFMRLSPNQPLRRWHRFQHLYAPFLYWLVALHTVFFQDFVYLFKRNLANMTDITHRPSDYLRFALCKFSYLALVWITPIMVLPLPWWQVVCGILIMSFVTSVLFVTLLIGTHFAEGNQLPRGR